MPTQAPHICNKPGCMKLTHSRFCEEHEKQYRQQSDQKRGTAHQRGYTPRWRKARLAYLRKHPLCKHCEQDGKVTPATVVDHIIPHKGNKKLFWDSSNWQPLCKRHHDIKTATEDGAFGRKK